MMKKQQAGSRREGARGWISLSGSRPSRWPGTKGGSTFSPARALPPEQRETDGRRERLELEWGGRVVGGIRYCLPLPPPPQLLRF
nr:unnamed protein product [Digitaria exilis]